MTNFYEVMNAQLLFGYAMCVARFNRAGKNTTGIFRDGTFYLTQKALFSPTYTIARNLKLEIFRE